MSVEITVHHLQLNSSHGFTHPAWNNQGKNFQLTSLPGYENRTISEAVVTRMQNE
jgi:hypothetical protein